MSCKRPCPQNLSCFTGPGKSWAYAWIATWQPLVPMVNTVIATWKGPTRGSRMEANPVVRVRLLWSRHGQKVTGKRFSPTESPTIPYQLDCMHGPWVEQKLTLKTKNNVSMFHLKLWLCRLDLGGRCCRRRRRAFLQRQVQLEIILIVIPARSRLGSKHDTTDGQLG